MVPSVNALSTGLQSSPLEFSRDRDASFSEASGSCSGLHDKGNAMEGLYLPTIVWDPRMPDKPYRPWWKSVEYPA
ncbi:hypothetical protein Hanom_Chr11g00985431 [Helianthus anomalus]